MQLKLSLMKNDYERPLDYKVVYISVPNELEILLNNRYFITSVKTEGLKQDHECRVQGGE